MSLISWAFLGIIADMESYSLTLTRVCITFINLVVGIVFIIRKPLARQGTTFSIILCLPSLFASGLAYKLSPAPNAWPGYAEIVFVVGAVLAMTSFLYLGRCFAIFPAIRGVVADGPYRVIRHPAYLGELLMVSGCFFAGPKLVGIALLAVFAGIAIRILAEEKLLLEDTTYGEYVENVAWRLVPGIW